MNWGYKIITGYIIFVGGIMYLVYRSASQNQDLVTPDYYEQELKYQDRIDESRRADALSAAVKYELTGEGIRVQLPPEMKGKKIAAELWLYCIADKSKDIKQQLVTEDATFYLPSRYNSGLHQLKVTWTADKLAYYSEHKIVLP